MIVLVKNNLQPCFNCVMTNRTSYLRQHLSLFLFMKIDNIQIFFLFFYLAITTSFVL